MKRHWQEFRAGLGVWAAVVVVVMLIALAVVLFTGCQTVDAIATVPDGYWSTTWALVRAVALDLWSVVQLLLPV